MDCCSDAFTSVCYIHLVETTCKEDKVRINQLDLIVTSWSSIKKAGWSLVPDTGVCIYHIPSGIKIKHDGERSQYANRAKAMIKLEEELCYLQYEQAQKNPHQNGAGS